MSDHARRLRQSIARFERLLSEDVVTPDLAEAYRAEIAAAKAMLDEVERGSPVTSSTSDFISQDQPGGSGSCPACRNTESTGIDEF